MRLRYRLQAIYFGWFLAAIAITIGMFNAFQKDLLGVMSLLLAVFLGYTVVSVFTYVCTYTTNRQHPDILEIEARHMDGWWTDPPII